MNDHLLEQIKEEFPDWRQWIGELYLQWDVVSRARLNEKDPARRWVVLLSEIKRIRREVENEGRAPGTFYFGEMDEMGND